MQILELCESCDAKAHPSHGSILEFGRAPGIFDSEYGRCGCAVGIICAGTSAVYAFLACVYSKLIAVDTAAKGRSSGAGVFREPHSSVQGVQFSGIQPQLHIVAPRTTFERGSSGLPTRIPSLDDLISDSDQLAFGFRMLPP